MLFTSLFLIMGIILFLLGATAALFRMKGAVSLLDKDHDDDVLKEIAKWFTLAGVILVGIALKC